MVAAVRHEDGVGGGDGHALGPAQRAVTGPNLPSSPNTLTILNKASNWQIVALLYTYVSYSICLVQVVKYIEVARPTHVIFVRYLN